MFKLILRLRFSLTKEIFFSIAQRKLNLIFLIVSCFSSWPSDKCWLFIIKMILYILFVFNSICHMVSRKMVWFDIYGQGLKLRIFDVFIKPLEFIIDKTFFVKIFMCLFRFENDFLWYFLSIHVFFLTKHWVILSYYSFDMIIDFLMNFSFVLKWWGDMKVLFFWFHWFLLVYESFSMIGSDKVKRYFERFTVFIFLLSE